MKILVVRFSSIGDIVLTSPVVRCLKRQLGEACQVHFLTKNRFRMLMDSNPHVDKVFSIEKNIDEVLEDLIAENYSVIIDLHHNLRSIVLRGRLGVLAYTFRKENWNKWLLVNFKINRLKNEHVVDRYFEAVAALGVSNDEKGLDFFVPGGRGVDFDLIDARHRSGYVAVVIGGTYSTKRLPADRLVDLCKLIRKPIFLIGGGEDSEVAIKIKASVGDKVYNGCGTFDFYQSADIIQHADIVVTHDTGMMHIAAAFKRKIISIWGNTVPEFGMYPYLPDGAPQQQMFEVHGLKCRPCSKLGYKTCPKRHFNCMNAIDIVALADAVNAG